MIDKAFILAAGKGTRLRPYTDEVPKPMVQLGGRPIIDYALDGLADIGVKQCGVNSWYKAEILEAHLQQRSAPEIIISREEELLETGGGLKHALSKMELGDVFYVMNGDTFWEDDADHKMLRDITAAWDPEKMDILIALFPVDRMKLTKGVGDYDLDDEGRAVRSMNKSGAYNFTSVRINAARIFDDLPKDKEFYSYLELLDAAQEKGRLYGMVYEGMWHHISTPDDLEAVNASYGAKETG